MRDTRSETEGLQPRARRRFLPIGLAMIGGALLMALAWPGLMNGLEAGR